MSTIFLRGRAVLRLPRYIQWRTHEKCQQKDSEIVGVHDFFGFLRVRAVLTDVLLGPRPSLPSLRIQVFFHQLSFVRLVHRYYGAVRLLRSVHVCRTAFAFSDRSAPLEWADKSEVSRFSCMKFPGVPGVYDYAGLSASSR